MASHTAELVHEHTRAEDGIVIDDNLSCQLGAVADDAAVAHHGIMCHMTSLHQQVVAAHLGAVLCSGTPVDGHVLTYLVVVTDDGQCILSLEFQVLGNCADDGTWKNDISIADAGTVQYCHAVHQRVVVSDFYILVDVAEWTDFAVLPYFCFRVDTCQRTDF